MCWRIFLICGFLIMCLAVYVSNGLGHLRGVGDADTKMMRNLSRAVLLYHEELGEFLDPSARENAAALEKRFGIASDIGISTIEHTGVKGLFLQRSRGMALCMKKRLCSAKEQYGTLVLNRLQTCDEPKGYLV